MQSRGENANAVGEARGGSFVRERGFSTVSRRANGRDRDWFAYKGRPAARPATPPKAPAPAPKEAAPAPAPEAPKPPEPAKKAGAK